MGDQAGGEEKREEMVKSERETGEGVKSPGALQPRQERGVMAKSGPK